MYSYYNFYYVYKRNLKHKYSLQVVVSTFYYVSIPRATDGVGFTSSRRQTKECFCHAAPPSRRESCPWRRTAAGVGPAADRYRSRSRPTRPLRRPFAYLDASGSCVHNPPPTTQDRYTPADYRLQSKLHWYVHAICARSEPNCASDSPSGRLL